MPSRTRRRRRGGVTCSAVAAWVANARRITGSDFNDIKMQTDWYNTKKLGTYLVLPTGRNLRTAALSREVRKLMKGTSGVPFFIDVDSRAVAQSFNFFGIDDSLRLHGFGLLRS